MNVYEKKIAELERANAELRKKITSAEKYDEGGSRMKINDKMIIKCNNAEEYSWLINELDKEDIFIFAIDPVNSMGIPERLNGREVNWDNKSYEKWFHDRRYFNIRSDFKLVHVMYQDEAIRKHFMRNYLIAEAKELMKKEENSNAIENNIQDEVEAYCYNDICFAETAFCDTNNISESKELMEEKEMKENVKYTDVYKKEVKCLVRTDITPWENCGIIGTIPYKEAINDLEGTILKVGDYVKIIDIRNERSQIVTSIIVDNGNRLVPYCYKDYDISKSIDREHDNLFIYLLIKVGEFPTYSNTVDPEKEEPSFVVMTKSEFDKQALTYYKAQYKNTLSKLEVLQKKYDNSYRTQISLENTNELLKRKIEKMESHMDTEYEKSCTVKNDNSQIPRESIIPPNKIIACRTKEECKWIIEEMEKVNDDDFYKFICAHDHISRITTEYLNSILEDPIITSVLFYFSYDTNPFKVYYYKHDEFEVYEIGSIIEASDLMKQEENKDEN